MRMRRLRTLLKDLVLSSLYFSGMLWLIARSRLKARAVVLTYHRVLPADRQQNSFSSPGILVTPETFDWQMRFLRRHFHPLTPETLLDALRSGAPLPYRSCLVTFDDGWHDVLEFALPILRRHGVPAVLFVPTGQVGATRGFWQERVARLVHALRQDPRLLPLLATRLEAEACDAAALADRESIFGFVARIKARPIEQIESLLAELERLDAAPRDGGEDRFLGWPELGEIAASGVMTIGSHGVSHRPLTKIPISEARQELAESARVLDDRFGRAPALLAYPNGDADRHVAAAAAESGYSAAFTTERGHVATDSDRYQLRRVNMHESATWTRGAFLSRLLGLT